MRCRHPSVKRFYLHFFSKRIRDYLWAHDFRSHREGHFVLAWFCGHCNPFSVLWKDVSRNCEVSHLKKKRSGLLESEIVFHHYIALTVTTARSAIELSDCYNKEMLEKPLYSLNLALCDSQGEKTPSWANIWIWKKRQNLPQNKRMLCQISYYFLKFK